jgi:hypothetical protein
MPTTTPTGAEAHFRAVAPAYMRKLLSDFPALDGQGAAAIFGNLGHESLGFTKLQEMKPTVKGSRGGWGWAQWTGPRRKAFEAYCKRTGKDPASNDANYAYLFVELKGIEGSEAGAIARVVAATGLQAKVEAFEKAFLRAGVKHYESRLQWARIAVDAFREAELAVAPGKPTGPVILPTTPNPPPPDIPSPDPRQPEKKGGLGWLWIVGAAIAAVLAFVAFVPLPI